ncbi:MAG: hypothetical protein ABL902_09420, partial [Gallionella sp.]
MITVAACSVAVTPVGAAGAAPPVEVTLKFPTFNGVPVAPPMVMVCAPRASPVGTITVMLVLLDPVT